VDRSTGTASLPESPVADHPLRRTHRWGLPAFLLAEAVFLGLSLAPLLLFVDPGTSQAQLDLWLILFLAVVPTLGAAALALLVTRWRGNGPRADLGLVWCWRDVGLGLAFGIGGLVLGVVATAIWVSIVGPDQTSAMASILEGRHTSVPVALLVLLAIVVVAPFCEEVLYRGLLWGALEKLGAGPWLAFAITTVAFAVLHFEPVRAPLLLVVAVPIGLARLLTGRLVSSVVAHQVNNLLPGIVMFLGLLGVQPPG